jgi:hypothetical protein
LLTLVARSETWSLAQSAALVVAACMVVMRALVSVRTYHSRSPSLEDTVTRGRFRRRLSMVTFRGAVKYPGDGRDPPVYLSWSLAYLSMDSVGLELGPSWSLVRVLLKEKRWPWSAILTVQAVRRGVRILTRDLGEGAPIVFLVDLPGLIRTTPRLLDSLERYNAPLDRHIHRTGWFSH